MPTWDPTRKVPEWRGKTPDAPLPPHVFTRLYRAQNGRCPVCTRLLQPGNITREHLKPISMGGENREGNIELWCTEPCSAAKTPQEARSRAKADRVLGRQIGAKAAVRARSRPIPGSRTSGWKHKVNGTWVRRDEEG